MEPKLIKQLNTKNNSGSCNCLSATSDPRFMGIIPIYLDDHGKRGYGPGGHNHLCTSSGEDLHAGVVLTDAI